MVAPDLFLQEQKLIDESSSLENKLTELIHKTESGSRPGSESQPIKSALDNLLAEAHTSKDELLDQYKMDHERKDPESSKISAKLAGSVTPRHSDWVDAPKQDQFGQDLVDKPIRSTK